MSPGVHAPAGGPRVCEHRRVRLAIFSPLPPIRSGIAAYTAELLTALAPRHAIDVFVGSVDEERAVAGGVVVRSAHDFVWARRRTPYDLVVYQLGNATCHDYMWPYLVRWPGLVVLHERHLQHARARRLLQQDRPGDYAAELFFSHPEAPPGTDLIGLAGYDGPLVYLWPMDGIAVRASRAVAVHDASLAAALRERHPGVPVHAIPMGVADAGGADASPIRARHGLGPQTLVIAAFGGVTPEKRVEPLMRAFAVARAYAPDARLLLVGGQAAHFDAAAQARTLGIEQQVTMTGYVPDEELPAYLAASDVIACLRWPTGGETSAAWLRALAAGRATVITDLAAHAGLPVLDPRSWTMPGAGVGTREEPMAIAIDLLDETHSLTLALKRLVRDAALRDALGMAGKRWWAKRHTLAHMAAAYENVLVDAAARPDPDVRLPEHLRPDGREQLRRLLGEMRVPDPLAATAPRGEAETES